MHSPAAAAAGTLLVLTGAFAMATAGPSGAPPGPGGAASAARDTVVAEIRARRARFNDAIAARDTAALARVWAADVRVITSAGGRIDGRTAYRERFAGYFADRQDYTYRREPTRIEVFEPWGVAAEHGTFHGRWRDADGPVDVGGEYLIQWTRTPDGWLVHAELFVPRHCTGGRYCSQRP